MKLFVAKLNFKTTEEKLRKAFEAFGTVSSVKIVQDRETRKSKGFGFVEMDDDSQANAAIAGLHGKQFDGREIVVQESNK